MIKNIINKQREQMQIDITCILDGLDDKIIDNVCQVIVDRCNNIKTGLDLTLIWLKNNTDLVWHIQTTLKIKKMEEQNNGKNDRNW